MVICDNRACNLIATYLCYYYQVSPPIFNACSIKVAFGNGDPGVLHFLLENASHPFTRLYCLQFPDALIPFWVCQNSPGKYSGSSANSIVKRINPEQQEIFRGQTLQYLLDLTPLQTPEYNQGKKADTTVEFCDWDVSLQEM